MTMYIASSFQDLRTDILFTHLSTMIRVIQTDPILLHTNYMDDARSGWMFETSVQGDAAWVYYNTPMGTPVTAYTDYLQRDL